MPRRRDVAPADRYARGELVVLGAILGMATAGMLHRIAIPWLGHHDWNGAIWSVFARNFLRYGYGALGFGHAYFAGPVPDPIDYYTHHTILITVLLTEAYRLFGMSEMVARLTAGSATLIAIVVFHRLVRTLFDRPTAMFATTIFALCPMTLYFGRMYNHEAFELCGVVVCMLAYVRWTKTHATRDLAMLGVCFFAAAMTAWPGYYLTVLVPLHHWITAETDDDGAMLTTILLGVALFAFAIYLLHAYYLKGPQIFSEMQRSMMKGWFSHRVDWGAELTNRQVVKQELQLSMSLFTKPAAGLAVVGFGSAVVRMLRRRHVDTANGLLLMLLVFGIAHLFLFKQEVMMHDYYLYYLLPGVALAAGLALRDMWGVLRVPVARVAAIAAIITVFLVTSARGTLAIHNERRAVDRIFYVELGRWMNGNTEFGDRVLVNFKIEGPFLMLYGDRELIESVESLEKVRELTRPRTVVALRAGRTPRLERYMRRRYVTERVITEGETVYVTRLWQPRHRVGAGS
jgi:hypothetical protein